MDVLNNSGFILVYVFNAIAIVAAITLFEFAKALTAVSLGDNLPKTMGRLTLNPVKHFEPIGFLLFLFLGYGWGKPVEISNLFKKDFGLGSYGNRRLCVLITYTIPMVVMLVFGLVFAAISKSVSGLANLFLCSLSRAFVALFVFNIIPVYPLCGSRILKVFLSPNASLKYSRYEKVLQMTVIFLLLFRFLTIPLDAVVTLLIGIVT